MRITTRTLEMRKAVITTLVLCALASGCASLRGPAGRGSLVFPNAPGSRWVYALYHTRDQLRDTITVSILKTETISDGSTASLWLYSSRYSNDTVYVRRAGDEVNYFIRDSSGYHLSQRYLFPLSIGRRWSDAFQTDTSVVAGNETVTVPAGTFANTIRVDRSYPRFNYLPWMTTWFAPDTGIVKQEVIEYEFGPVSEYQREQFTLLSYSLVPADAQQ